MPKPVRLQLSRRAGFNLQEHSLAVNGLPAVVVARPTKWGNPYDWRDWLDDANSQKDELWFAHERKQWCREQAVEAFAYDLRTGALKLDVSPLRGRNLACWCPDGPHYTCHADVLLVLANRPVFEAVE